MIRKIGILCAIYEEIKPYTENMTDKITDSYLSLDFISGELNGCQIVAVECGTGKTNAAFASSLLISRYGVDVLVISGVGGSIDKSLAVFDTVISESVAHHDVAAEFQTEYRPWLQDVWMSADTGLLAAVKLGISGKSYETRIFFGRIVSGEAFIADEGRAEIIKNFAPLCVDMETASVAQIAYMTKTPYIAVRTISDTEDGDGIDTFKMNCGIAAEKSFSIVCSMLKNLKD